MYFSLEINIHVFEAFFEIQPLRRWIRDKFYLFFLPKDNHIFISIEVREFGICKHGILYKNKNEQTRVWIVFKIQLVKGVQTDDNKRCVKKKPLLPKTINNLLFFQQRKRRSRICWSNYTCDGTQAVIANGFNGFSVCFAYDRGLFVTEQSENNLRDTYVCTSSKTIYYIWMR